jgi:predicted nucleic acid-binding protein
MIVVADSSPLIVLVNTDLINVLPTLFSRIVIPLSVSQELMSTHRPEKIRDYFSKPIPWLDRRAAQNNQPIPPLHAGETEALNLAAELGADFLLVDERRAYREATARQLNAIGTIRVLELAAQVDLIDLAESFQRLQKTNFWISPALLAESLRLHYLWKNKDTQA